MPRDSYPDDQPMMAAHRQTGSGLMGFIVILIGLLFVAAPLILPVALDTSISTVAQLALVLFGLVVLVGGAALTVIAKFWVKVPANRAFIRTGRGGAQVVIDGGIIFVPFLHEGNWVSLETIPLVVKREGPDALFTNDKIRADVTASFFISIEKTPEAVKSAAAKLGRAAMSRSDVQNMVGDIFDSALRQVAAEMEIADLMVNRQSFQQSVKSQVDQSIRNFGLILSEVTISRMDQTPRQAMRTGDNMFDAEGDRRIAEKVSAEQILSNAVELKAKREIEQARVETQQLLYTQRVNDSKAAAETDRTIAEIQARESSLSATAQAEQERISRTAALNAEKDIAVAEVQRQEAEEVAKQAQQRAVETASIARQRDIEVANREKEIAVAAKETERANAEAERLAAEANRQAEEERVHLVQVESQANRDKVKSVVAAEAEAQRRQIDEQAKADVAAYTVVAAAKADQDAAQRRADAKLISAKAEAESRTIEAEATANALTRQAEGDRAIQMVPVDVEARRVEVQRANVAVERERLEAQTEHESIARGLQVELAQIDADKEVRVAQAQSLATAFGQANFQMWGTPDQLRQVTEAFMGGQAFASTLKGFAAASPDGVKEIVSAAVGTLASIARDKGIDINPAQVEQQIEESMTAHGRGTTRPQQ